MRKNQPAICLVNEKVRDNVSSVSARLIPWSCNFYSFGKICSCFFFELFYDCNYASSRIENVINQQQLIGRIYIIYYVVETMNPYFFVLKPNPIVRGCTDCYVISLYPGKV